MKKTTFALILLVLIASAIMAQPHPPRPHEDMPRGGNPEKEKLREKIEMMKMWKMVEMLELTTEQSAMFFPIYNSVEKALEEIRQSRQILLDQLEKEVAEEKMDDKTVSSIVDSLQTLSEAECRNRVEFYNEATELLNLRQQAMFALFERRFAEEVKQIIEAGKNRGFPERR